MARRIIPAVCNVKARSAPSALKTASQVASGKTLPTGWSQKGRPCDLYVQDHGGCRSHRIQPAIPMLVHQATCHLAVTGYSGHPVRDRGLNRD